MTPTHDDLAQMLKAVVQDYKARAVLVAAKWEERNYDPVEM